MPRYTLGVVMTPREILANGGTEKDCEWYETVRRLVELGHSLDYATTVAAEGA